MKKYIDISSHQQLVDFEALKGHVDGVIIRAGYGKNNIDSQFHRNASECNRLKIPCGAYWFSYAYTPTMALNEAKYLVNLASKYEMELPLAFDYEYDSVNYGLKQGVAATPLLVQSMTNAFCEQVEKSGYWCMLYANPDFINRYFGKLAGERYDLWLASWPSKVDVNTPPRSCGIWQWGSSNVPGINGAVDTNESYKDYAAMLRSMGLNNLKPIEPEPERPWYYEATQWAKKNNIITDDTQPEDPATRAEVIQMLYNYYNAFNK